MKISKNLILLVLTGALAGISTSSNAASWVVHDSFSSGPNISDTLWTPTSVGWNSGLQEIERSVSGGAANLGLRAMRLKGTFSEGASSARRNRLQVKKALSEGLVGMQAKMTVLKASVRGCSVANSEISEAAGQVQAVYFNTGAGDPNDDSNFSGEVFVTLATGRSDQVTGLEARAYVGSCDNSDCSIYTNVFDEQVLDNVQIGQEISLRHVWKQEDGTIKFTAKQGPRTGSATYDYTGDLTVGFPSVREMRANIQARTDLAACESGSKKPKGVISIQVNEVRLKK